MEFRVLGPVELWAQGRRIDLGPAKTRLLLAVLLLESNRTVAVDTLVYRVWDEAIPARVLNSVQSSLSRLRRRLEECDDKRIMLNHVPATGYRLIVPPDCVDVLEFTRITNQGRAAADRGEHKLAVNLLATGEQLVRGEPLAGLPGPWAQGVRAGLQERHRAATLLRIGLQLESEDPNTLIGELRELSGNHPFDEAVTGLLMRALNAAGRTADALAEYDAITRRLRVEKAIYPHAPLKEIHRVVLGGLESSNASASRPMRPPPAPLAPPPSPSAPLPQPPPPLQPSDRPEAPNTLERDPPGFVGRSEDLDYLIHEVKTQLAADQSALCVIDGMPGVGKSTLALRLAHSLRDHCPDGALHLNLRGHDSNQPATSAENALGLLLGMMQTDAQQIQHAAGLDHAIALWRRRTSNKRLLLLLDDAAAAEQILPLIPGGSRSIVIVTARTRLADLPDAIRHPLSMMRRADASALFAQTARLAITDDSTDKTAVNAVVTACGSLPLALSIAGGTLRTNPAWSVVDLLEHLGQSFASAQSDTLNTRMTATFDTSYRDLPDLPRRLFRRLALFPGPRINLHTAAALADASLDDTDLALTILFDNHLINEPQRHQYRMHELLRLFAANVLTREESEEERKAAATRVLHFTTAAVDRATEAFHPYRHINLIGRPDDAESLPALEFSDAQRAATWLDAEQATLRVVIEYWHSHGHAREAAALAHMLGMYLDRRGLGKESARLHENAVAAWSQSEDPLGQATALTDLATAYWRLAKYEPARDCCISAMALWNSLGNTGGLADALLQLGRTHHSAHEHAEAIDCFQRCIALREANGEDHGQAVALYHLGGVMCSLGRLQESTTYAARALELAQAIHDEATERNCANNLGEIHGLLGDFRQAESFYSQALGLARRLGDSRGIAVISLNLGDCHTRQKNPEAAIPLLEKALETFRKLDNENSQINTLLALVRARLQVDEQESAQSLLDQAKTLAAHLGDPLQLANIHLTAGDIHLAGRDHHEAELSYRHALDCARSAHVPFAQAAAHCGIGDALAMAYGASAARIHWQQALKLYETAYPQQAEEVRARFYPS